MSGYTKRDKTTSESEIFFCKPDKRFKIWFYIVWHVHWQDYKQRKRGENWFSYEKIMQSTKATKKQVSGVLERLRSREMIETKKATRWLTIKVLNYAKYQDIIKTKGNAKETQRKQKGNGEGDTIEEEERNKEIIIITWTSNQEKDESIKNQIREIIPIEVLQKEKEKYYCLVELIALGLKTEKTEKWIQSRIYDIEKKLDANQCYNIDMMQRKEYDRQKAYKIAQTCRTWNEAQEKECGNPLNSFNKFLSTNK